VLSKLRDFEANLRQAATIPPTTAGMIKAGLKTGAKVLACMIAAHELQTHAGRLLGQAAGEVAVLESDELAELKAAEWHSGYDVGMQNGACAVWLHASQLHGFPVPAWVLDDIKRLGDAGQWHQGTVVMEAYTPGQQPARDDVDEGQADEVAEAELVDEPEPRAKPRPFAFAVPRQTRETVDDAG
jgi:hypothetical protein